MKLTFEIQDNPVVNIVVDSPTQETEISYGLADGNTIVLQGNIRAMRQLHKKLAEGLQEADGKPSRPTLGSAINELIKK